MDSVLFCPFCGEAFEGMTHCPEHELLLVPWAALPRSEAPGADRKALPWYSLARGRGLVASSAALVLLAFVALPLAHVEGALHMGGSMLRLALHNTPRLWLVPIAALAELMILYRRRSPASMRGARLALLCVGCVPPSALMWTWLSAKRAVALLSAREQLELHLHFGAGAYLVWLATVPLFVGGLRLGRRARRQGPGDSGISI
jgi:hypothetical protein